MNHKHHDVLVAWAEGRPIQYRYGSGVWTTLETETLDVMDFGRREDLEWRVKPDLPWYMVALLRRGDVVYTTTVDLENQEDMVSSSVPFVRWLTDRISYEVWW